MNKIEDINAPAAILTILFFGYLGIWKFCELLGWAVRYLETHVEIIIK